MQARLYTTATTTTPKKTISKNYFYEKETNRVAKQPVHFIA